MISKIQKEQIVMGRVVINGCGECMFNDKKLLGNKGYCRLLEVPLPENMDSVSVYHKCPLLPKGMQVSVFLEVHSYSNKVK